MSLVLVQAIIAFVGLGTALGKTGTSEMIVRSLRAAVPGPAGEFLTSAVLQAQAAGATHQYAGLVFGLVGSVITGTTLMGQFERALNRIYGIEQDRPTLQKYGRACVLAITTGVLACSRSSRSRSARRSVTGSTMTPLRLSGRSCAGRSRWR